MIYEDVLRALQAHKVRYLVAGGLAVNLLGIPRLTADIDLLVELSQDNLKEFLAAMKECGYVPRLPVAPEEILDANKRNEWIREKNLKAFTFWNKQQSYRNVDVLLLASETRQFFERGKKISSGGLTIFLASPADLITMKSGTGRKQDLSDIEALKQFLEVQNEET